MLYFLKGQFELEEIKNLIVFFQIESILNILMKIKVIHKVWVNIIWFYQRSTNNLFNDESNGNFSQMWNLKGELCYREQTVMKKIILRMKI